MRAQICSNGDCIMVSNHTAVLAGTGDCRRYINIARVHCAHLIHEISPRERVTAESESRPHAGKGVINYDTHSFCGDNYGLRSFMHRDMTSCCLSSRTMMKDRRAQSAVCDHGRIRLSCSELFSILGRYTFKRRSAPSDIC